jgi:hypothetical protein
MWSNYRSRYENLKKLRRDEQLPPRVSNRGGQGVHTPLDQLQMPVSGETRRIRRGERSTQKEVEATCRMKGTSVLGRPPWRFVQISLNRSYATE